jgi:uncharacterized protein YjbI with pentapeptide repeats
MATVMQTVRKIRGSDNRKALLAVEELRARGWLEDGSLEGVRLCHAHLENADLLKASLRKIDFHQAYLTYADLTGADLTMAKLMRADLRGADFGGANIADADFLKANLSGAKNLTDEQLSQAKRLCFATMPDGLPYDGRYRLSGDRELAEWGKIDTEDQEAMAYFYGVPLQTYLEGQQEWEKTSS